MNSEKDLNKKTESLSAAVINKEGEYAVLVPCSINDFGKFMSGLLGKAQVLKGEIWGSFDAGHEEISSIYHLVTHRVEKQNKGTLSHFSVTIYYDNGDSITHNDVQKFKNYHPTEQCYPISVVLTFIYIIIFPGKDTPEKQTIEVSLSSEPVERQLRRRRYGSGLFEYKIDYTDRTWATDIAGLLKAHGNSIIEKDSQIFKFIRRYNDDIISYTCTVAFFITILIWSVHSVSVIDVYPKDIDSNELILSISKYFLSSFTVLACLGLLLYLIHNVADNHLIISNESFITLTDRDTKRKTKILKRQRRQWIVHLFMWLLSVAASIVANYLYK